MKFRPISTPAEVDLYRHIVKEHASVTLPPEYCATAEIVAGFNHADEMVGGFLIAPGHAMRWPGLFSSSTDFMTRTVPEELLEIDGLWLSPSERRGAEAVQLWARVGEAIDRRRVRYVTYATDVRKRGLIKLYTRISSGVIRSGATHIGTSITVFYLRPWRIRALRMAWETGVLQPLLFRKPEVVPGAPIRRWYPFGWLKKLRRRLRRA